MGESRAARYSLVTIALHWTIALLIVTNLAVGWWMNDAIENADALADAVTAFQLHKSIGLTVLLLSVLRLTWRLSHTAPGLPATMLSWERWAARGTHCLFYVFMIVLPLSGWLYVSTQWRGDMPLNVPTLWFGSVQIPHLFDLNLASQAQRESSSALFLLSHQTLIWSTVGLLALHVFAALKHQFKDRDDIFLRMLPGAENRLRFGVSIAVVLVTAVFVSRTSGPSNQELAAGAEGSSEAAITSNGWQVDASVSNGMDSSSPYLFGVDAPEC